MNFFKKVLHEIMHKLKNWLICPECYYHHHCRHATHKNYLTGQGQIAENVRSITLGDNKVIDNDVLFSD